MILAMCSGKGGVGKTTVSVNLAVVLSRFGKVLAVDSDVALPNLHTSFGLDPIVSLLDVLRDVNQLEDSIYEVKVRDRTFHSYVHVLPAATSVKGFKEVNIKNFRNVLEKLRNDYDFIILDVAAGLSKYAVVPILSSDAIYLVTNPEKAPILNAQKVRKVADASGVRVEGIILNRYRGEKKMVKYAEGTIGSEVVGIIRESRLIEECWDEGIPAAMKKPNSRVARDFMNLARRIIGEDVSIKPYGKLKFLLG